MSLSSTFGALGAHNGTLYLAGRALERLTGGFVRLHRYYLVAQPVPASEARPLRPDAATEIRRVTASDPLAARFPRPPEVIARRFGDGAQCTVALVRGEFAGFIWIQRERYDEDEVRCVYELAEPRSSAWDFDVYVEPRFRAGRTMARLWLHVNDELRREGVRWSFSRISAFNAGSLASHARLGIRVCGSLLFVSIGRCQLMVGGRRPWLHVGWRGAPRVQLRPPA